jgi:hypothetical protein
MRQGASQENSNVPSTPLMASNRRLNPVKMSNAKGLALNQRVQNRLKIVFISSGQPQDRRIFQET